MNEIKKVKYQKFFSYKCNLQLHGKGDDVFKMMTKCFKRFCLWGHDLHLEDILPHVLVFGFGYSRVEDGENADRMDGYVGQIPFSLPRYPITSKEDHPSPINIPILYSACSRLFLLDTRKVSVGT